MLIAGQFALPGEAGQALGHLLVNGAAVLAVLAGIALHRPRNPLPWLSAAATLAVFALTNWAWSLQVAGSPPVWAEPVDRGGKAVGMLLISLTIYAFLSDGRMVRRRAAALDATSTVLGGSLLLILWAMVVQGAQAGPVLRSLAPLALASLTLVFLLAAHRLARAYGPEAVSIVVMIASAALGLAGQGLLVVFELAPPRWIDATWMLAATLVGVAALHPTMDSSPVPPGARERLPGNRALALAAALLINVIVVWLFLVFSEDEAVLLALGVVGAASVMLLGMSATDTQPARGPSEERAVAERRHLRRTP